MIKKIIILSLISTSLLLSAEKTIEEKVAPDMVNFGIIGKMYDIKEENFMDLIKRKMKGYDFKKIVTKTIVSEVEKQGNVNPGLGYVKEKRIRKMKNSVILDRDIKKPNGEIVYKKGTEYMLPDKTKRDFCFVDGSNMIMLKNQISYFDKLAFKNTGRLSRCIYFVAKLHVQKLSKDYPLRNFYPLERAYADKFMVQSLPTYIHIENGEREIIEFPIDMFKHEVK